MTPALLALTIAQPSQQVSDRIREYGLADRGAHRMLTDLCTKVGNRLSGSESSEKSIVWMEGKMSDIGLANIRRVKCMVPVWVRGHVQRCDIVGGVSLRILALGGSGASEAGGTTAEVVEVQSLDEVKALGEKLKGKIVFYNRPFDPKFANPGAAYGGAGDQRRQGPALAQKYGAVGALVRSLTDARDDVPHTGGTGATTLPAAALGPQSADRLSKHLKVDPHTKVTLELACKTLPDKESANVIGEITGTTKPNEVIVLGGHLDSWDVGQGAHDDGSGVVQGLEALRLMKVLGLHPKRTIRAIGWMNEENGGRGAKAYLDWAKTNGERCYAAMESDSGGFQPRSFGISKSRMRVANDKWLPMLRQFGIERFEVGGGEADNGPLESLGAILVGLQPDAQRYFDYHHTEEDTLDKVHPRELENGAMAMAMVAWLLSEE